MNSRLSLPTQQAQAKDSHWLQERLLGNRGQLTEQEDYWIHKQPDLYCSQCVAATSTKNCVSPWAFIFVTWHIPTVISLFFLIYHPSIYHPSIHLLASVSGCYRTQ